VDLEEVPNPYLEKILVPFEKEPMFLETMRGCPYLCKYCFYSKSYPSLRFFPEHALAEQFVLARDYGVPEIYLMDPSFNVAPELEKKLKLIRQANTSGIPIHTEIRLETVTPEIARDMKSAGFHSVEAGLQSVNEKSLAAIGRHWNREEFIRGARLLRENGIDVKTGVILGLPYDDPTDFERTIDFVMELNLEESMEIYPLSLIPGTVLRDQAANYGLSYMLNPPYWVLSTGHMGEKDIKYAVEMVEDKLGIEFFPPVIPRFENIHPTYIHFLDLREKPGYQLENLYRHPERVGGSLTVLANEETGIDRLLVLGDWLARKNPYTLVQLVLDRDTVPPEVDILRLRDAFHQPPHYFNHVHHYKIDSQRNYSFRIFHLTGNLETAESYLYQPFYCDLVLRYTPRLLERGKDILDEKPIALVDSPIDEGELKELKRLYEGFENFLVFNWKKEKGPLAEG
ncbi:MAG: radical SAM protein, partial [bacterium]|nr:radical SAM protein [bacterium]